MSTRNLSRYAGMACLLALVSLLGACSAAAPATQSPPATAVAVTAATPAAVTAAAKETGPASGPTLEGSWEGSIDVAGQKIPMVVRLSGSGSGIKGLMDITAQAAKDIPLNKIREGDGKLYFETFEGQRLASYDGALQPDGSIAGKFSQAGYTGTFTLKRQAAQAAATATVPYKQEEVTVKNGAVSLAGTLTLPASGGPSPAVVLISGSGQQNRDEDIFGFQPFRMFADHFTRNGIAVLRLDDRGIGGSTGDVLKATSQDFAGDVASAVAYLKSRSDIDAKQIGLLGHSEGGLIAPMVATQTDDVAFLILLAGPGVTGEKILERQVADVMKSQGAPQAQVDQAVTDQKRVMRIVITGQGWDELKAEMQKELETQIAAMSAEQLKALGGDPKQVAERAVADQVAAMDNPWFKFFLSYDPAPALAKVDVPVLAVFGGKDVQVAAAVNEPAMKTALDQGGNKTVTTKVYPEANHLMQPAVTGSPNEYATLKTFVPGFLDDMTAWIQGVLKK